MDKEFVVVVLLLLVSIGFNIFQTVDFSPQVTDDVMELYWDGCDNSDIKGFEYQADCELRQVFLDANLIEAVDG